MGECFRCSCLKLLARQVALALLRNLHLQYVHPRAAVQVSMSSTSIVIKCLSDTKSTNTPHGAITIGTLILQVAPGPLTGGNPGTRREFDIGVRNRHNWCEPAGRLRAAEPRLLGPPSVQAAFLCRCTLCEAFCMSRKSVKHPHPRPGGSLSAGRACAQDCMVGLLFAFMPVLAGSRGGTSDQMDVVRLLVRCATSRRKSHFILFP